MSKLTAPYFPIIYVRGYAMTPSEVADTVSTPYLGVQPRLDQDAAGVGWQCAAACV